MQVNREELLRQLESVLGGTTMRDTTEQSSCFGFRDGQVVTFSDEVACVGPCSLELTGAVPADPFVRQLQKMPEDTLEILDAENEIKIKGKGRGFRLNKEAVISMPTENLEPADGWQPLSEEFADAVRAVQECAAPSKSEEYIMTCIHVHPNFVEACDNIQCARWKLETGVQSPFLVKRDSIKHICDLGMTEFSETPSWIHFRNPAGLHVACRRIMDPYKDTSPLFDMKDASPLVLPKGLEAELDRAKDFAKTCAEGEVVRVELLSEGKMRIVGQGQHGRSWAKKTIQYAGPPLKFIISPDLLTEVCKRYNECRVNSSRLKAKGGGFSYVTVLGALTQQEASEE